MQPTISPITIHDCYIIKNGYKEYQFPKCLEFLQQSGRLKYGQKFKIQEQDHKVIYKLIIYAIQDKEMAHQLGIDLKKGILLSGPVGCGKTSLMNLIKPFVYPKNEYRVIATRTVAFEFGQVGFEALGNYTQKSMQHGKVLNYCFDDLGAEQQIKHFGNECNVMAEILNSRYDAFIDHGCITHLTTNLSATELEKFYGNRVRSRLRAMFNLISFDANTTDKRI